MLAKAVPSSCWILANTYSSRSTELYNPKAFITHAASLRQAFAHCAIFLIAASRRSRGRVSVPVRRIILSDPLPVVALVSRYLTNKLIGRRPIFQRADLRQPFGQGSRRSLAVCGISRPFERLSPTGRQVVYVLLDRSPLAEEQALPPVRLAYLRHAASVRPEPGSNSPRKPSPAPFTSQLRRAGTKRAGHRAPHTVRKGFNFATPGRTNLPCASHFPLFSFQGPPPPFSEGQGLV